MPRRVLMIAPYFPPRARVGARRPLRFARYLPEFGITPLVVSLASASAPAAADREVLSALERFELYAPFDRTERPASAPRGKARGSMLDTHTPIDTWWPLLVAQAGRVIERARKFAPDVVWSTADPWSSHALAMRVARALELPWLADFRDPWSLCRVRTRGRPRWVQRIDAHAERTYIEAASRCTFTSERTTARYRAAYPAHAERFHTIENSFDPASYQRPLPTQIEPRAVTPGPALTLTFFGRFRALSSAARTITMLAAARALDPALQLRVRCQGGLDATDRALATEAGVSALFESYESTHGEASLSLLAGSDVLLLSSETGRDEIIPAKLFDYLAAARPVLSLCENPDVADILARTGAGIQCPDPQRAAQVLVACAQAKRNGMVLPIAAALDLNARDALSARATTRRLATLLHDA